MERSEEQNMRQDTLSLHYRAVGPAAIRAALLFTPRNKKDAPRQSQG